MRHGDVVQNASLTCTNTAPRRLGNAPRGQIANVEYPHLKCGASFGGLSRPNKAAGQRYRALTRKQATAGLFAR